MGIRRVRVEVTSEQSQNLRKEVFGNLALSGEQRRRMAKKILLLPGNGSPVDLYHEGTFVGAL
jgi:hypothetical protein